MRADRTILTGISLACFANLLLEVVITRLFSATMFYHFTFLAVALALFGIAASGVYVFVNAAATEVDLREQMARATRRFAVGALVLVAYSMANPMDIIIVTGSNAIPEFSSRQVWQLAFIVGVTAVPFFYGGVVVSLALTYLRSDTGRVYAWDLAGSAAAALVTGAILSWVGGPSAVIVAVIVALVAAALFEGKGNRRWAYVGAAVLLLAWNARAPIFRVPTSKGVKSETVRFEKWNSFSRVTVDNTGTVKIDASASTHIENLATLRTGMQEPEVTALAHAVFNGEPHEVLVIGPGGGRDVLHALAGGATHVTGVEVNPIIADRIMKGRYLKESGGLYTDPRVHVVVDDGRSFVRRSEQKYDMIQASLVDTWAATAAGAFALSENGLYTLEAFEDYLGHLTDRGLVTMTRWHTGPHAETARLLLLGAAALETIGVAPGAARSHMFYAINKKNGLGTMVLKKAALTPEDLTRLTKRCVDQGFDILVSPTSDATNPLARYLDAGPYSALVAADVENLAPPTDDRPFFFYFKRAGGLLHPTWMMNDPGLWIVLSLTLVTLLSAVFVLLPLVLHWRKQGPSIESKDRGLILGYFGLVGFAFIVVEVAMLQRFTLFLGHPSYSLLVVLFALLLSTAVGAWLTTRVTRPARAVLIAGLAAAALAVLDGFVLPGVLRSLIQLSLPVRVVISAILIAPSGICMGFMMPTIIRVLNDANNPLVPWGWGVNGATSVIGTVIATVVAIYAGFTVTFCLGAACYVVSSLLGARMCRRITAG